MPQDADRRQSTAAADQAAAQGSDEERMKSHYVGKNERQRNEPLREHKDGAKVRVTDSASKTHYCTVKDAKLEGHMWKYRLVETLTENEYQNGAYISQGDVEADE